MFIEVARLSHFAAYDGAIETEIAFAWAEVLSVATFDCSRL